MVDGQTSTDAIYTADELFRALAGEDAVVIAHVGGRYADLKYTHDGRLERAVEVHSTWGTFEWLLHDAFEKGCVYRLPEQDWSRRVTLDHTVSFPGGADLPVYLRATQSDGHQAWSSPIYLIA